ncbi:hypothetical protein [Streptomyces noursei]|uniref:hypothetical protein n=1 Tax=Streptomyces noursei TaxID=1971 RepID=UPI003808D19F
MITDNSSTHEGTNLPGQSAQTTFFPSASTWDAVLRRNRAEDLIQDWRRIKDAAENEWEQVLADRIRHHAAYLHPVYRSLPTQALLWGVDTKNGPVWDSTEVRLLTQDGTELCAFDLHDGPEVTMGLDALSALQPPLYAEDELYIQLCQPGSSASSWAPRSAART